MKPDSTSQNPQQKDYAKYAMSFSLLCMALALSYFTWQIGVVSQQIPDILQSVEKTSARIEPVLLQVNEISDLVPPVLNEVTAIRKQIPLMLEEVKLVRQQVPVIVEEVKGIRQQVPAVLTTIDDTNKVVASAVAEVKATRPLVPKILQEVKLSREIMPTMLDRADNLVANMRQAGKEASKGAITGLFTGIIAAPFEIMGELGEQMLGFSEEEIQELSESDLDIVIKTTQLVASSDKLDFSKSWHNADSDTNGIVTLVNIKNIDERPCKIINSKISKLKKVIIDRDVQYCLNENNEWKKAD